ncbi:hypothetical protein F5Y11DRAFT_288295 [Daldinia sp. FL1419]|nr:hypothetical protein F5Y11DRAFT_288295 [Daldinia sp. FL1419]
MGSIITTADHSYTSSGRENLIACAVLIGFGTIAVLLRIWVRITQPQCLQGHDYLCILSLALFYAQCGLIINFIVRYGAFETGPPLKPPEVVKLLKMTWILEFLFSGIITTVKLSILWFYYTIFFVNKIFKQAILVTTALCIVWFIVATLIILFQCNPIDAFWNQADSPSVCINSTHFLLGYEITNLLLDVVILAIPLFMLGQLQLSAVRKASLWIIFILGGLVCVASIVRLRAIYPLPNPTQNFDFSILILWGEIQSGTAIICACLPTLGPLFSGTTRAARGVRSWYGSSVVHSTTNRGTSRRQASGTNKSMPAREWPNVEDQRYRQTSSSWIRVDESVSDTFPLKPVAQSHSRSTSQNTERP